MKLEASSNNMTKHELANQLVRHLAADVVIALSNANMYYVEDDYYLIAICKNGESHIINHICLEENIYRFKTEHNRSFSINDLETILVSTISETFHL
jgi:hypothetical protein